jgi:cell division protein FtsX
LKKIAHRVLAVAWTVVVVIVKVAILMAFALFFLIKNVRT